VGQVVLVVLMGLGVYLTIKIVALGAATRTTTASMPVSVGIHKTHIAIDALHHYWRTGALAAIAAHLEQDRGHGSLLPHWIDGLGLGAGGSQVYATGTRLCAQHGCIVVGIGSLLAEHGWSAMVELVVIKLFLGR